METYYKAINWNAIEDVIDKSTWEKLTEQFWLDTRIPLSNDLDDWRKLSNKEKDLVGKVFGGLTLLDTMQSETGVQALRSDIRTPHDIFCYASLTLRCPLAVEASGLRQTVDRGRSNLICSFQNILKMLRKFFIFSQKQIIFPLLVLKFSV